MHSRVFLLSWDFPWKKEEQRREIPARHGVFHPLCKHLLDQRYLFPTGKERKEESFVNKAKKMLYSQKMAPVVFCLPFCISLLVFWLYPLVSGIVMSFQTVDFGVTTWVGLQHYKKLAQDPFFKTAVLNSVEYMLLTLLLLVPIPMLLAVLIESRITKARGVWKVIMYIPALTSVVISGMLFRLMFSEGDGGQMNQLLHFFGHASIPWLKSKGTGWIALLLLCMWRWTGVNMLYFVSGLNAIDGSLYESAEIDGANAWQKFWYITLPLLRPTTVYVITISVFAGLSMFLESYMLWGGNSSPKNIGLTIVGYLYKRGIETNELGYACAVGVVLMVIALIINFIQLFATGTISFKKKEE